MSQTILVVDDDDLIRTMVTHFLKNDGYTVITAANGATALDLFKKESPALVVLDIAMPSMSGIDVAKEIRAMQKRDQSSRTPIIMLTAYARSFFLSASSEAGVDSYLTKPITGDKLLEHVHRFVGAATPKSENGDSA
ncbi:MAG: response regulator [Anaerolineae bacterium]|nr:response regulator [Anaerolineae bacterium]